MKVKVLFEDRYRILATMDGDDCPVEEFLAGRDPACSGLLTFLQEVSVRGLDGVPSKWAHEVNKQEKIFEFIKGDYRLFFFKGEGADIAICVCAGMKKGQKADAKCVALAVKGKHEYSAAVAADKLEVINED